MLARIVRDLRDLRVDRELLLDVNLQREKRCEKVRRCGDDRVFDADDERGRRRFSIWNSYTLYTAGATTQVTEKTTIEAITGLLRSVGNGHAGSGERVAAGWAGLGHVSIGTVPRREKSLMMWDDTW